MQSAKGRIAMALSPSVWRVDLLRLGLIEIAVDGETGITAAQLDLHGDPADRIIAATALLKGAARVGRKPRRGVPPNELRGDKVA